MRIIEFMDKELITPGKLYAKLSAEFRTRKERTCTTCRMPMVFLREEPEGEIANWLTEAPAAACEPCKDLIADIVRNHAARYDLWDPTAIYARRPLAAFVPTLGQRTQ